MIPIYTIIFIFISTYMYGAAFSRSSLVAPHVPSLPARLTQTQRSASIYTALCSERATL